MPDERIAHFIVPSSLIHSDAIRVRGRSRPVPRPSYSAHGDYLRERAASVKSESVQKVDSEATESIYLQVKTPPHFPIEKERERLAQAGLRVVSLSSFDPTSGTAAIRKKDLEKLEGKLETYSTSPTNRGRSYLSVIEDLQPVPAEEKVAHAISAAEEGPIDCLLLFYSTLTESEQARVLLTVRSFMRRVGADLRQVHRLTNGVLAVEARMTPLQALEAGGSFSTLRYVRPDNLFFAPDSWRLSSIPEDIPVDAPSGSTGVALFDTGVDPSTREIQACLQGRFPRLPPGAVAPRPDHGTFVASRVAYGDGLRDQLSRRRLSPITPIVDVPMFGVDSAGQEVRPHEGDVAAAIDAVIPHLPSHIRILNLALGCESPIRDDSVSLVASLLDYHTRQRDILAVTTAGNVRDPRLLAAFPHAYASEHCRIDSPGDSLNAITVGSIALVGDDTCLSRPREVSAFSRRGPGPFGCIKPDLVAHGGNCRADGTTTDVAGVYGLLDRNRGWAVDFGTSYAAPVVSSMAARLMDHYDHPSANLVKALLLHFTREVHTPPIDVPPQDLVGRGEPDLALAMWATPHAATFLSSGELTPGRFTFIPFQVPPCLGPGTGSSLRIRATVVINPAVSPDNPLEYSCCRLTLALRKPAQVGHSPVSGADSGPDPGKWSPIEEISRRFRRSYSPGRWELQVRLWARHVPEAYTQPYAAVIQVVDENGRAPVIQEIDGIAGTDFVRARVSDAA